MPVPLRPGLKKPKTREDESWNKVRITEANIDEYFEDGDNVGGLWGKPSGWIVDIDLDWDEAAVMAPAILPPTFVYGRLSRPNTHYLYRCRDIKTFKRGTFGKNGSVIVEVRSTGTQSVLPPSVHPDGERFEINKDTGFTVITKNKLERLVNRLAAAAVFVRHYPDGGGRHDYVHALTGALLWAQWDPEGVATFMLALLNAVSDREDDIGQRERTVINTIEKYSEGEKVNGWPTLEQWIPEQDVRSCKKWCMLRGTGPTVSLLSKDSDEAEEVPDELPELTSENVNPLPSLTVPGLVGRIAAWVHRGSYANQPLLDLGAAFTILALATQNKYIIQSSNTPLSPFFMALSRTGGGKDSARQAVVNASKEIKLLDKVFSGFQSFHAMLDQIAKPPSTMCWLWDEAARRLKAATKSVGGPESQVVTWLLDLYGKGASTVVSMPGRKQSIPQLDNPFLIVMAFAQPEQMIEAITTAEISTGLLNRFILLDTGDGVADSHMPDFSTGFPSAIANPLLDITKIRTPDDKPFINVMWDSQRTFNKMQAFREEVRKYSDLETSSGEIYGRAWQNALILAGLLAVGVDYKKPVITEDMTEWAINFIKWSCNAWMIRIDASSARSLVERHSKTVERMVREPYAFRKYAKKNDIPFLTRALMPKSMLYRMCRHMKAREMDEVVSALIEADVIGVGEKNDVEIYWFKRNE